MPGKNIKIYRYNQKLLNNVDYIFWVWNFKKKLLIKKKFKKRGGKFISHVPKPHVF